MPQIVVTDLRATGLPWARFQRGTHDVIAIDSSLTTANRLALLHTLGVAPAVAAAVA